MLSISAVYSFLEQAQADARSRKIMSHRSKLFVRHAISCDDILLSPASAKKGVPSMSQLPAGDESILGPWQLLRTSFWPASPATQTHELCAYRPPVSSASNSTVTKTSQHPRQSPRRALGPFTRESIVTFLTPHKRPFNSELLPACKQQWPCEHSLRIPMSARIPARPRHRRRAED